MDDIDGNGWSQYEKLVLQSLADLKTGQDALAEDMILVRIDVAKLKVKAGIWGGLAGLVPGAIGVLVLLIGGSGAPG